MDQNAIAVLLLEDDPGDTRWIVESLHAANGDSLLPVCRLTHVGRLDEGLNRLGEAGFDIILCDPSLPDSEGAETFRRLHQAAPQTPLILMIGSAEETLGRQAVREGAQDYLYKSRMEDYSLTRAIRYALGYKQAIQAAHESEKRFRALIENSTDGIVMVDVDGIILYASPATTRILGYTAEELLGQNGFELIHPDDLAVAQNHLRAVLGQTSASTSAVPVIRLRHRDGTWRWMEATTTNLLDKPGVRAIVSNFRDITERRQAEETLRYQAMLVESISDAVISTDANFVIRSWNKAAERLHGYRAEEVIGHSTREMLSGDYIGLTRDEAHAQLLASGQWEGEVVTKRKDGSHVNVFISTTLLRDGQGNILGMLAINHDITERKRAEVALQESEQRFRLLFNASPDAILLIDPHDPEVGWPIVDCNETACEMNGYTREEFIGQSIDLINVKQGDAQGFADSLDQLHRAGAQRASQAFHRHKDGHIFLVEYSTTLITIGGRELILGIDRDITERTAAEEALRASEARLSDALHIAHLAYWEREISSDQFFFNDQFYELLHTTAEREGGYIMPAARYVQRFVHPGDIPLVRSAMQKAYETTDPSYSHQIDHRVLYADGEVGYITVHLRVEKDALGRTVKTHGANQDITERKQRERELEAIAIMSAALRSASTHADMLSIILDQVMDWLKAESTGLVMKDPITGESVHELARGKHADWIGMRRPPGQGVSAHVIATGMPYLINNPQNDPLIHDPSRLGEDEFIGWVPLIAQGVTIGALWVSLHGKITNSELRVLAAIADIAANAIRRAALHEETRKRAEQLAAVNRLGRALAETLDLPQIYEQSREAIFSLLPDIAALFISGYSSDTQLIQPVYGYRDHSLLAPGSVAPIPLQDDPQGECIRTRQPVIVNQVDATPDAMPAGTPDSASGPRAQSALYVPMIVKGVVTGVFQVQCDRPHHFADNDASLLAFVANTAAIAIENARLFAETRKQLERLQALRTIDGAVTASLDLRVTLSILLEQVTSQLGVDAASILLLHPHTHTLEYNAGRGFRTQAIERTQLRIGEDFAGRAALERRPVSVHDLAAVGASFKRTALLTDESFVAYYAVPLITKGSVKGVLEIYHRAPLAPDYEWKGFAETLAGQAAIAVENVSLFNELQRSNTELTLAYDTTLEGWTRALDLRDKEIEGHTQRVTEMSTRLGRAMGLDEIQLIHLRRGALLHDIGNFGVPDSILHKPGPLTDEEWAIVRKHSEYAYNLLRPITFLRQAIDIPYCHHERWDGNGYPRGLKGEHIPVAARIYAVVDVWEALRADRPYRPAWPPARVRDYLAEQSGRAFDPQVVELFLKLFD